MKSTRTRDRKPKRAPPAKPGAQDAQLPMVAIELLGVLSKA
jgi:hypothetical protein